ncbi:MAG: hypothetical protein SNJ72_01505 [Fimbriimonadales bacterium]
MATTTTSEQQVKERIQRGRSMAVGALVLGLVGLGIGLATDSKTAFQAYHLGFFYWFGMAFGCLGMSLLIHAVRGKWGLPLIRIFESGARTIPFVMLAYLPVLLFGMYPVYEWTHKDVVATDPVLQGKAPFFFFPSTYEGLPIFFYVRYVIYLIAFSWLANYLWKSSVAQDNAKDPLEAEAISRGRSGPAAGGIVAYMLLLTIAMVDYGQSLQPHWFSTMYAVIMVVSFGYNALALAVYMVLRWRDLSPYAGKITYMDYRRDWGNLLFTLTVFWSYVSFSQLLITYSGNLYEFTQFYLLRNNGGWQYLAYLLVVFQFFVPFFLFLAPRTKKIPSQLLAGTMLVMAIRLVHIFWEIKPMFSKTLAISPYDFAALLAFGGLWFYFMFGFLLQRSLLPQNEPRLAEVAHGHS